MTLSRFKAAISGGAAVMLLVSGCSSSDLSQPGLAESWDEIVEAGTQEGEVTIYATHSPTNLEALKVAFEKKYPEITLTYVRGTDADILPKVEVENQTGTGVADVHMTTDQVWINRSLESDYSTELVAPSIENPAFRSPNSVIGDKFFLTSGNVFGLGWNTANVQEGLTSPEDLLASRFTGKVGIQNPSGTTTYVDMYRTVDVNWPFRIRNSRECSQSV